MSLDPHQNLPESDEKQLCLSCMAPNEVSAHFCAKCRAPLSSYASTGPFESIFAEGAVYRQAAQRPRKLIVVLGVWLIFGPVALGGVFLMAFGMDLGFTFAISGGILLALSLAMLWKCTRNYVAGKKADETNNA